MPRRGCLTAPERCWGWDAHGIIKSWNPQPFPPLTKATDYLLLIFLSFNGSDATESSSSPPPRGSGASAAFGEQQSSCWKQWYEQPGVAEAARGELTLLIAIWLQHRAGNALPALGDRPWAGGMGLTVLGR